MIFIESRCGALFSFVILFPFSLSVFYAKKIIRRNPDLISVILININKK